MCNFSIPFSGDAVSLMKRAQQEIESSGGAFSGDASQGNFQAKTPLGSIQGNYQIQDQTISLNITKKPFLLSCKRIQKELSEVMR
jgi:hypothetical protein